MDAGRIEPLEPGVRVQDAREAFFRMHHRWKILFVDSRARRNCAAAAEFFYHAQREIREQRDPNILGEYLQGIVGCVRPDLTGCVIVQCRLTTDRLELHVCHGSFRPVPWGDVFDPEPLIRDVRNVPVDHSLPLECPKHGVCHDRDAECPICYSLKQDAIRNAVTDLSSYDAAAAQFDMNIAAIKTELSIRHDPPDEHAEKKTEGDALTEFFFGK